jgi:serine protease Do
MLQRPGAGVLLFLGSFLGGLAGAVWFAAPPAPALAVDAGRGPAAALSTPVVTDLVNLSERFEAVARQVLPAVVAVEARKSLPRNDGGKKAVQESGSGVIVAFPGRAGHFVLTNHHVVAGAELARITIQVADGRLLVPQRAWGDAAADVAVLEVSAAQTLPAAVVGDSDKLRVGQWVLAMGSPFGLNQTVTHGIISATGRGEVQLGSKIRVKDFIQTDAAINPGSSGGPLVNLGGEVIGINTAIASESENHSGIAFSIPSNLFRRVALELLERGQVVRGYVGVQLSGSFEAKDALKLGLERGWGALVEVVHPGSPAADGGLRPGDVILELDNVPIRNENQFITAIAATLPGKSVSVVFWRERRRLTTTLKVGDWAAFERSAGLGAGP